MMSKKSKADVLESVLESELQKHDIPALGRVFSMGATNYLAGFVYGRLVVDVVGCATDKKLDTLRNFKKSFGSMYRIAILTDDSNKNVMGITSIANDVYTLSSLNMLMSAIKREIREYKE